MPVLVKISPATHVYPVTAFGVVLKDELVEVGVGPQPLEPIV